jgi:hypothetical protein
MRRSKANPPHWPSIPLPPRPHNVLYYNAFLTLPDFRTTTRTCQQQWHSCIRKHGGALETTALASQTTRTASPMVSASPTGLRMSMGTTSRSEPFRHWCTFHTCMLPMHMLLSCQTPLPVQMPAQSLWPARTRLDNPDVSNDPSPFPPGTHLLILSASLSTGNHERPRAIHRAVNSAN